MMSLVRAQLGEPQQSSLLTTLFPFLSKFTAKSGERESVKKTVLWTVFSELGLCECCLITKRGMRGSYFPPYKVSWESQKKRQVFTCRFFSEINPYEFVKYALREQTISPYTTDFASFSNTA